MLLTVHLDISGIITRKLLVRMFPTKSPIFLTLTVHVYCSTFVSSRDLQMLTLICTVIINDMVVAQHHRWVYVCVCVWLGGGGAYTGKPLPKTPWGGRPRTQQGVQCVISLAHQRVHRWSHFSLRLFL